MLLRKQGNLKKGVRIEKGKGLVKFVGLDEIDLKALPKDLDPRNSDHIILATALTIREQNPRRKVILVSRDINLRVIAQGVDLPAEEYENIKVVEAKDKIYTGFEEIVVDDEIIDRFYADKPVFLDRRRCINHFIQINSLCLCPQVIQRRLAWLASGITEQNFKRFKITQTISVGISFRETKNNRLLMICFTMMILVSSLSSAVLDLVRHSWLLLLVLNKRLEMESQDTRRLLSLALFSHLVKTLDSCPEHLKIKMMPWLKPIGDNIEHITSGEEGNLMAYYMDQGKLEVEALSYIRGRSISNAYIIIDEAQNLTAHEVKTILTRVGENTKIILTGDIEQIDNIYTNETSNGLTYAVEKFKHHPIAGHVTFKKGERSKLATIASQIL